MFNRRYIFKGLVFHCHVRFPTCTFKYSTVVASQAERAEVGVYDTTLRLSVGIEDGFSGRKNVAIFTKRRIAMVKTSLNLEKKVLLYQHLPRGAN